MHHFRNTYPTNTNTIGGYLIPDDEDNNTLPLAEINIAALQLTAPTNLSTVSIPYSYRFGFNGQERELGINQSITSAEYWFYDGRLGRRWNVDPVVKYWESGYACFFNNPIRIIDPKGLNGTPRKHTTVEGDTYSSLSKKYKVSIDDLRKWNKYVDTKIPLGVQLTVSNPDEDLKIGGSPQTAGTGEDFMSHVGRPAPDGMNISKQEKWSNEKLVEELGDALTDGTLGAQDNEAQKLTEHFAANTGNTYYWSNSTEQLMRSTPTFKNLENTISNRFQSQMVIGKGDYNHVQIEIAGLPNFTAPQSPSLKTLIGGTQQLDIYLSSISYGANNTYTATLTFMLYDDFGLSASDITNASAAAQLGMEGLKSLWVLQHQRGYNPFNTCGIFSITVNGKF